MRLFKFMLLLCCFASCPLGIARASDAADTTLARFVDDQTILIVRIDAARIDVAQMREMLKSLAGGRAEQGKQVDFVLSWIPGFVQAGGKELYLISSMASMTREPFFAIAPLSKETDPQRFLEALGTVPVINNMQRELLGSVVFAGSKQTLDELKKIKPVIRKELALALKADADAVVQIILMPSADTRRVIEEAAPLLPSDLGGGSVKALTRGMLWATLGVDGPPKTSVRLIIQSEDAAKASDFANFCKTNLSSLAKNPSVLEILPGFDGMQSSLIPNVEGDRLTLNLDEKRTVSLLQPLVAMLRMDSERMTNANQLKQIGLAIWNYHEVHKTFPTVANFDAQGKPLLSWRVHLLPYLGGQDLYKEFHLDESWDSEHNKKLISRMPAVFKAPGFSRSEPGLTTYLAPVAANALWTGTAATVKMNDITDGTSNTIMLIDAADKLATPWTKPSDYSYDPQNAGAGLGFRNGKVAAVEFADGSVRTISKTLDPKMILALFTRNGGEVVSY